MSISRDIDARQTADVMREILRKRRAGEAVELHSFGVSVDAERLSDFLGVLDRVESARKQRGPDLSDGTETLLRAADLQIAGYELLRPLGVGGHGVVRQARRLSDGQFVAIKFLREWQNPNSVARRRFLAEAKIQRELAHPSIVPVIDSGRTNDGLDYLVMPYIDGEPLNPNRRLCAMPLEWRLRLFLDICRAVAAAHDRGIIHRDLKPSNILIDSQGRPRLVDFGLATNLDAEINRNAVQATGKNLGTYLWCSYEQLDGQRELSPASDVFSLGVILHQMLCEGRFPPDVLRVMEAVLQSRERRAPSRAALSETLRPDLRKIIERCLSPDPSRRYPNAGALADAIGRALVYQPRRSRAKLWLAAIATVALATAAAAYFLHREPSRGVSTPFQNFGKSSMKLVSPTGSEYWLHYAPPGRFIMGASAGSVSPLADEIAHEVVIKKGFYICSVETTQELYEAIMGTNPSRFRGSMLPVERVSYEDAMEFCRRLSRREGKTYRLPSEEEWEYACRAGSTGSFEFGDDPNLMIRRGNVADLSNTEDSAMTYRSPWNDRYPRTAPVATFISNVWRLNDMHGNVWEWCLAPYVANPNDPSTAVADHAGARGGSWWDDPLTCRSANRNPLRLSVKTSTVGFRIVCEANE